MYQLTVLKPNMNVKKDVSVHSSHQSESVIVGCV